jgi:hypothetical protein
MQNIQYSHPYVDSVSMNGDQITLKVEVTDFKTTEGGIEISGQATQVGGAFAAFSQIVDIATATTETDADGKELLFVTVTADTIPPYRFKKEQDITIFVRVAKAWVTVLGEHDAVVGSEVGTDADATTMWDRLRKAAQLNGEHWPVPAGSTAAPGQWA